MDPIIDVILGTVVQSLSLLIVVPLASRLADFSLPPFAECAWRLFVVVAISNITTVALGMVMAPVGWLAGMAVFWVLMVKWFDVDFFGAIIIVLMSWLIRTFVGTVILMAMSSD